MLVHSFSPAHFEKYPESTTMDQEVNYISSKIFDAFLICPYKSFLLARGLKGDKSNYTKLCSRLDNEYRSAAKSRIAEISGLNSMRSDPKCQFQDLSVGQEIAFSVCVNVDGLHTQIDAVKKAAGESQLGGYYYDPVIFCRNIRINKIQKLSLAYRTLVLGHAQSRMPDKGFIIHGPNFTNTKIGITSHVKKITPFIDLLSKQFDDWLKPALFLNSNCSKCPFKMYCRKKAEEADHLSLLSGISQKEVARYNRKGIFTVNQLSYTFRSRKHPKRAKPAPPPHSYALKALSLRENKVHIHGNPKLPTAAKSLYIDIEGIPDRDLHYLIGLMEIGSNGEEKYHYFWADKDSDQGANFVEFLSTLRSYDDYVLYHFGNYERQVFKKMRSFFNEKFSDVFEQIRSRAVNILSIIYSHIYFPLWSNGLKEIAKFLGFKWTNAYASGLNSIVWRMQWEWNRESKLKHRLIEYNYDDCRALRCLVDFISLALCRDVAGGDSDETESSIVHTHYLRSFRSRRPKFQKIDFVFKELDFVNNCSYFDYQRDKIFVRTNKMISKINTRKIRKKKIAQRIKTNTYVELRCDKCTKCGNKRISREHQTNRCIIDLKFINFGVKRWVTNYVAWWYTCNKCGCRFVSPNLPNKHTKWGWNLKNWCVYQNLVCGQNMNKVRRTLEDLFSISLPKVTYRFKSEAASRLQPLTDSIFDEIISGKILHADETQVNLWREKGYVWVFANMESVYFLYRGSRKAEFLKELLADFRGVLVSDFFSGYDSLNCRQQKCIIHLIRDMNQDLRDNPFDEELKGMLHRFAIVMKNIVCTIDKYGLKRRNLNKHQRQATRFVEIVKAMECSSVIANKYQKRINKYGDRLFTFLHFDGIPWNNNVAEHAIKSFAKYRTSVNGRFTEKSITEYLTIHSVFQTCENRGIDTLKFLLSGEKKLPD